MTMLDKQQYVTNLIDETKNENDLVVDENEFEINDELNKKKSYLKRLNEPNSIISSDSGSVIYEHDLDELELESCLKVKLKIEEDFYISSEDESSHIRIDLEKHKELNKRLKEESKFGKLELSDKERLNLENKSAVSAYDLNIASEYQSKKSSIDIFHDDWFFSENMKQKSQVVRDDDEDLNLNKNEN